MVKDNILPIEWEGWDEFDTILFCYYKVKFLEDFGDFKEGDLINCLQVDFDKGLLTEVNDEGEELREVQFKCTPV